MDDLNLTIPSDSGEVGNQNHQEDEVIIEALGSSPSFLGPSFLGEEKLRKSVALPSNKSDDSIIPMTVKQYETILQNSDVKGM